MFMDIELSKEINESFRQSSQAMTKLPSGIELSVHVLNTVNWPTYPPMDARLPPELTVSQTFVLMLFSDAQKLSLQDIRDATRIEDNELRRTLQSLACGKVRVLQKIPEGSEVDHNDSFVFNDAFKSPLFRIKVNAIQLKETVEENASTIESVNSVSL
ncbi:cullin-4 [Tanacetum coccineum]|uniref:Cullin-4 n=1 Tax=Tanacetum coccineum TaxID=301880 RepID=A0ABQ4WYE3_9ASTR